VRQIGLLPRDVVTRQAYHAAGSNDIDCGGLPLARDVPLRLLGVD
jgi:hypothetical protein